MLLFCAALALLLPTFFSCAQAQLSGPVGPLTSATAKASKKTCNVLAYGAKADKSTDLGPPLLAAFNACKTGGLVLIPPGDYLLSTWVSLSGGSAWALQLDGTIYRSESATAGGNMIFIQHTSDFEMFSSNRQGAMQGNGFLFHKDNNLSGPRLLRFYDVKNFKIHDIKLTAVPNGEVYNMLIRGGDHGGLDGIDVFSDNIWIHDIMVTNKDECVTTKSPSTNLLIENIYCNWSGGCAFGSLGASTAISNIIYRNIYTQRSNQMLMIKSNGGSGHLTSVLLHNFIGHHNAYSLNIEQYWPSMTPIPGLGVTLSNVTATNWRGTEANGQQRGPIQLKCADSAPSTDITIRDFRMWTETGEKQWCSCRSAYGTANDDALCLRPDTPDPVSYPETRTTVGVAPTDFAAPTMDEDLSAAFGYTVSIPIPSVWPRSYFPGVPPLSVGFA